MSKANVLASLATDVNELSSLADQISEIEGAIEQANTNFHAIQSLPEIPEIPEIPPPVLSFRNKLINGNFDIWQHGTSHTSSGYGSADRWQNYHQTSTKTASQQSFTVGQTEVPGNPKYYLRHVITTGGGANDRVLTNQRIEDVSALAGKTFTFSFWAKADSAKNIAIEVVQNFGTGGSPTSAITGIGVTTYSLTTSWQKFTGTISIPSISGKTIGTDGNDYTSFAFWFDAGSTYNSRANSLGNQSGTFDIAQVQLEEGEVATPFEHRPYGLELSLCQRYFSQTSGKWYGVTQAAGYFEGCVITWPMEMRTTPTTTVSDFYSSDLTNFTDISIVGLTDISKTGAWFWASPAKAAGNVFVSAKFQADAEL